MMDIDLSRPDRDIGANLSGDGVEKLREGISWMRKHRGLRIKDVALDSGVPEHTIRNFTDRKSNRPENGVLGRLYKFMVSNRGLLPDEFLTIDRDLLSQGADRVSRLPDDLIKKKVLPVSEADLKRVYDRYTGYYMCYRRSQRPGKMSVSWLHIMPLKGNAKAFKGNLPLPRFTLFAKYSDRIDPKKTQSYITIGYVFSRMGRIYVTGHHDGALQHFILNEPTVSKFSYLSGLCLLTSPEGTSPLSARIVCQYLGSNTERLDWEDKIGVFTEEAFNKHFENAELVMRAIGDSEVLIE